MSIRVNVDNFVEAETARMFAGILLGAGGMDVFRHVREPAPIDDQSVIRLNRDTLYSSVIVDLGSGPATLHLPDGGERYLSAMVLNESHHVSDIFHGEGAYRIDVDSAGSRYVVVAIRTLIDPADASDVAEVARLQDAITIEVGTQETFRIDDYDQESFDSTRTALLTLAAGVSDYNGMFGTSEEVSEVRHLIGTASGWGGLPTRETVYVSVDPQLPTGRYELTMADVPVDAFWSVSVYNAEGFFEPNPAGSYSVNSVTGTKNDDGSVTVTFIPPDGHSGPNTIPAPEGWNYMIRLYRPRQEVINGTWSPPAVTPAPVRGQRSNVPASGQKSSGQ